ncbi:BCCT family transporter [Varibaculum prostatecancerukia]|uniref:BCCT family transporter n=1 Tax=Varibaculum prostatecancerukia TaxID=2811781 RepID=UPI001C0075C1|nr:BCCT family transporter [Varibaculum prostatecancerukia]
MTKNNQQKPTPSEQDPSKKNRFRQRRRRGRGEELRVLLDKYDRRISHLEQSDPERAQIVASRTQHLRQALANKVSAELEDSSTPKSAVLGEDASVADGTSDSPSTNAPAHASAWRRGTQIAREQTQHLLHKVPYPHGMHPGLVRGIAIDEQIIKYRTDKVVFLCTGALVLAFILWGIISTDSLRTVSDVALQWVVDNTGWLFSILAAVILLFMLFVGLSRYGNIPLGRDNEEPEYSYGSWIAMMFSAGMGIGLLFFGPYEPMIYFTNPAPHSSAKPGTYQALNDAMSQTMLHWGLNAWAIYALVGCAIAYGTYRRGRVPLISSVFAPLLGHKFSQGGIGQVIDMLAITATLFGTCASLGMGGMQIRRGIELVSGIGRIGNAGLIIIISVLTAAFIASAVSGISRGIRLLSNINMGLAFCLMAFIFLAGPTVFILNLVPSTLMNYLSDLFGLLATSPSYGPQAGEFASTWTVFYWAWWISWSPFVGLFIARISRGRTLRQFVTGVLLAPTLVCLISFCIYGGTTMYLQIHGADMPLQEGAEVMLFALLQQLPLTKITSLVAMFCLAIFFITSADSASVVMGSLSQQGKPVPDRKITVFWGLCLAGIAVVGMLVGGQDALQGMQNLIIVASLPFAIIIAGMIFALLRDLSRDPFTIRRNFERSALSKAVIGGLKSYGDDFKIVVVPTKEGEGAGADFDYTTPEMTEWYRRTDTEGNPIDYDYASQTYLDKQGNPVYWNEEEETYEDAAGNPVPWESVEDTSKDEESSKEITADTEK